MSQFVRKPPAYSMPADCILFPGRLSDSQGWVDPGTTYDGVRGPIHPMISAEGFRQAARKHTELGLTPRSQLDGAEARIAHLEIQLRDAEDELVRLSAESESIAGLRRSGFTVQKIKGPRPKEGT